MNTHWLTLSKEKRIEVLNQATELTGLPTVAIEKDWWVTLALSASFALPYNEHIVFKGGTSLSKGWNLIERFSEDIDLAIDRKFFGFEGEISKSQIRKLRKQSCDFIATSFLEGLRETLTAWKATEECELSAQSGEDSDRDPQVIEIQYDSVVDTSEYLPQRVLIEIGSRSLMEPTERREISSLLDVHFPHQHFVSKPCVIPTVLPQRTFLEKIFLLHEEFSQRPEQIRISRLSRHLYDLERLMDTTYGMEVLGDVELYHTIVTHREKFNPLRGVDYAKHTPDHITIVPPESIVKEYEKDYEVMTNFMIYGSTLTFQKLMARILELQVRIREIDLPQK